MNQKKDENYVGRTSRKIVFLAKIMRCRLQLLSSCETELACQNQNFQWQAKKFQRFHERIFGNL